MPKSYYLLSEKSAKNIKCCFIKMNRETEKEKNRLNLNRKPFSIRVNIKIIKPQ